MTMTAHRKAVQADKRRRKKQNRKIDKALGIGSEINHPMTTKGSQSRKKKVHCRAEGKPIPRWQRTI